MKHEKTHIVPIAGIVSLIAVFALIIIFIFSKSITL